MGKNFFVFLLVLFFFAGSSLLSQELARLARKEKERRARINTRSIRIVTNQDLKRLKVRPAVDIPDIPPEIETTSEESDEQEGIEGAIHKQEGD